MSVLADMAQDSILRQQVTLLFLQAECGAEMLLARGEPVLRARSVHEQRQPVIRRLLNHPLLLYGVLGCGVAVCLLSGLPGLYSPRCWFICMNGSRPQAQMRRPGRPSASCVQRR